MLANYATGCQCLKIEVINLFSWYNKGMRMKYCFLVSVCLCGFCLIESVSAASKAQEAAVVDNCEKIRENLKSIQKSDARTRVYLGGRYETILNKYVVPLNLKLVENNMSTTGLIEAQNNISTRKTKFSTNYVEYQQKLEELVATDCKKEPGVFYDRLTVVRQKRKKVEEDTQKMRNEINAYVSLVTKLKEGLHVETK